jgi:hypothetical protein
MEVVEGRIRLGGDLVPVGEPEHEARNEGANGRMVEGARVVEVAAGDGARVLQQLDESSLGAGRQHGIGRREDVRARCAPRRVHLAEEHQRHHIAPQVVATLEEIARRTHALRRKRATRTVGRRCRRRG